MKRRSMGKVKRPEVINTARKVGRRDAIKKRYVYVSMALAY
jgi:ATP-dependent RNA helicase DDX52/ROK1